jgi:hypothetical protein
MRRFLLLFTLLGLGLTTSMADPAAASERELRDSNRDRDSHRGDDRDIRPEPGYVRGIPLRGGRPGSQVMIESMILITDRTVFGAVTDSGVYRDSLHKLSGIQDIPLIGGFFGSKASSHNLGPETEVGSAYSQGSTLVITVWPNVEPSGIRLEVVPEVLEDLEIRLKQSVASDLPPMRTLPIQTAVSVKDAQSIVIAHGDNSYEIKANRFRDLGVDMDDMTMVESNLMRSRSTGDQAAPALSDVPFLGALFRARVYQQNKESLLVLIKPTILKANEEE